MKVWIAMAHSYYGDDDRILSVHSTEAGAELASKTFCDEQNASARTNNLHDDFTWGWEEHEVKS
jgi:hypothetical protein